MKLMQMVLTPERDYRWQVRRRHRDGTVTIMAAWKLTPEGRDVAVRDGGYVADLAILRRVPASILTDGSYRYARLARP